MFMAHGKKCFDSLFRLKQGQDAKDDKEGDTHLPQMMSIKDPQIARFMELNSLLLKGDFESRMNNDVEHAQLWIDLWSQYDLKTLAHFSLVLVQRKEQCAGILNLLVWASVF